MTEIAAVAILATGSRNRDILTTAVAITEPESGGNPMSHNDTPPDDSYGLWQINMLGNLGPARRQQFGLKSNRELFNPNVNAKAMWAISGQGTNWKPWTGYTSGAYRSALTPAREGVVRALMMDGKELFDVVNKATEKAKASGAPTVGTGRGGVSGQVNLPGDASVGGQLPGGDLLGGLDAIGAFFSTLSEGGTWVRILWVVAGLLLITIAAVLLGLDLWKGS
jgi:hypothetical protein